MGTMKTSTGKAAHKTPVSVTIALRAGEYQRIEALRQEFLRWMNLDELAMPFATFCRTLLVRGETGMRDDVARGQRLTARGYK